MNDMFSLIRLQNLVIYFFFNPLCLTCQNAADYNFKSND